MEEGGPPLPPTSERRHRYPGRLRVPDRVALAAVMYVLRSGVAWRDVPAETVGCSGWDSSARPRRWPGAGEGVEVRGGRSPRSAGIAGISRRNIPCRREREAQNRGGSRYPVTIGTASALGQHSGIE
ncbi:transposase [Streptomyces avermitilis]|uniref:transposase n=1 Tax=Streptomyces avermitilis TaxID=33903 RepID=UPI003F4B0B50